MNRGRRAFLLAMGALVGGAGLLTWASGNTRSPETPPWSAGEALARVHVSVTVVDRSLAATEAIADFGIEDGIRLVRVRIVDRLRVRVRIESPETVELAEPPQVCLLWRFSAPDDAGLSDRCWGEPDLGGLVAANLGQSRAGRPMLVAGHPVDVVAELQRGDTRCDYPPGRWQLEMALIPVSSGGPADAVSLQPATLEVPVMPDGPLPFLRFGTRFCGLATIVFTDQGEPQVSSPSGERRQPKRTRYGWRSDGTGRLPLKGEARPVVGRVESVLGEVAPAVGFEPTTK